nr:Vph1.2 [Starmerella bombicola]
MQHEAMFRSAEMSLAQIYVSKEISKEIVRALGELSCVHFRDLNSDVSSFQRAFANDIKRVDTCLRQIRFLKSKIQQNNTREAPIWDGQRIEDPEAIPGMLTQLEGQINSLVASQEELRDKQARLLESRHVVRAASNFFGNSGTQPESGSSSGIVAGVIPQRSVPFFEKVTWRALRGNLVFSASEIASPIWDNSAKTNVAKSVFILVTHGSELRQKAEKIAVAMDAHLFEVNPRNPQAKLSSVSSQLSEVNDIYEYTQQALDVELASIAKSINLWDGHMKKERGTYETLNRFNYDENRKLLIAEGWIPTDEIIRVQQTLKSISESAQVESPTILSLLETTRQPPTLHRTNRVTEAFQNMVDVYAIASYREVNPGLPTVVTFPFMFAVMFGDMGHGFLMFLAALVVVLNEKKLAKVQGGDVFDMFYSGRYVVLLMGIFSMFTGLIYNDLFSKSMTLLASGWNWPENLATGKTVTAESTGIVYKFGIDWMWHGAENNLRFMNSYKMKLSVILGYIHMLYSYMFSLVNSLYFNSMIDIVGNFIPGLIFFLSIFGYLSVAIIYKWTVDWNETGAQPPSLMNMLINMFLSPGKIEDPLFKGQKTVQLILLGAALISVPWLLLCKPLYLRKQMQQGHIALPQQEYDVDEIEDSDGAEHESFGDILIEQTIHTIEFCLNSVSHTASYLRLWALSLAHSQLSQVLWDMTLKLSFGPTGIVGVVMVVVMFAVWMSLTLAILTIMEGTSAMLHALRLHWVESMSKFYIGEGYAFEPFCFSDMNE